MNSDVPPGLTGDIFKDTELVEAKVREICKKINMTEQEKVCRYYLKLQK